MESSGPPPAQNLTSSRGIIATIIVLEVVSILVVALRFVTRIWVVKKLGWDDCTILFALIGTTIGAALDFVEVHYGFGRPQSYLTPVQLQEFLKYTYGEWIQTFATLMWTKVSICLFLLRIPTSKALIRPLQGSIIFLIISNVVLTLLWILQCQPVDAAWNTTLKGRCFNKGQKETIIISQAIISAVSDFVFASFPILILWRVQLKPLTKIGLCCLMGLGVITGACCIVRTVLNYQSIPNDYTLGGITNFYWRSFEVTIGIIAACIPALRPGYKWVCYKISTGRSTPSDQQPLAEDRAGKLRGDIAVTPPSQAHKMDTIESFRTDAGSIGAPPSDQIRKTTRIDVKLDTMEDSVRKNDLDVEYRHVQHWV